jgi:hypothetical protein
MTDFRALCAELLDDYGQCRYRSELYDRACAALAEQPVGPTDEENFLASMAHCMAFHPRDWGLDRRDAWLYGIVCGWGDALQEVAERHKWDEPTVERLQRLRAARRPKPPSLKEQALELLPEIESEDVLHLCPLQVAKIRRAIEALPND